MKKYFYILLAFALLTTSLTWANDLSKAQALASAKDYLGLRVVLIRAYNNPVSYTDWLKYRRLVYDTPQVGYDIIFAWDQHKRVQNIPEDATELFIEKAIKKAEELVSEKEYAKAFDIYQVAATRIKTSYRSRVGKENRNIYYWLLHQMGRTLYAAGSFDQALEVYNWIPTRYYQFRQVQFEKMWTAFRLNKLDVAMGSIISQQSSYFSKYIEPESYLVKIYILQKLCNQKEVLRAVKEIENYLAMIKGKKLSLAEWSKNDLYDYSSLLLAKTSENEGLTSLVPVSDRAEQKSKIVKKLNNKFKEDLDRLERDLNKVRGYALLMKFDVTQELEKVTDLEESDILSAKGFEYWPTSKNEEWVDEAGQYFYVGESKCKKPTTPEPAKK